MAVPGTIKQRARKAAWISFFTAGSGGLFWSGHWLLGLIILAINFVAFFAILTVIGALFGLGLLLWSSLAGTVMSYILVRRDALETAILAQGEQAERRGQILGGTA